MSTPQGNPTQTEWAREPVASLMEHLDPQYRIEGLNDDGEIDPDWKKIEQFAALMRTGKWDHEREAITMISSRSGKMVFDGNHRVLAADLAGVADLAVWHTDRPFG